MIGHNLQGEKAILRMREKILVNHITDKELISKTDKEILQLKRIANKITSRQSNQKLMVIKGTKRKK